MIVVAPEVVRVEKKRDAPAGLPADRGAISTLTWECEPLTSDRARLIARLDSLTVMDAGSAVWGGLNRTLSTLGRESGRRAVLLFSDGDDMGSPLQMQLPQRDATKSSRAASLTAASKPWRQSSRRGRIRRSRPPCARGVCQMRHAS